MFFLNIYIYIYIYTMGNLVSSDAVYKKSDIYTKKEVDDIIKNLNTAYTKQEVDTKFADLKKEYVWCADGQMCKVPDASNGLSIGGYSIMKNDSKLCLKFGEKSYCFDGNTVSQS